MIDYILREHYFGGRGIPVLYFPDAWEFSASSIMGSVFLWQSSNEAVLATISPTGTAHMETNPSGIIYTHERGSE